MSEKPKSAADPRPDDEPYFIDTDCPACGTELVLYAEYRDKEIPEEELWHDEWICPDCEDGLYLDVPDNHIGRLNQWENAR